MRLARVVIGGPIIISAFAVTFLGLHWLMADTALGYVATAILAGGVISVVVGGASVLRSRERHKPPPRRRN